MIARARLIAVLLGVLPATCTSFSVAGSPPIRVAPPPADDGRGCYEACLDREARANRDGADCADRCYP